MREATLVVPSSEPGRNWQEPGSSVERGAGSSSGSGPCLCVLVRGSMQLSKGFCCCRPGVLGFLLGTFPCDVCHLLQERTKEPWATNRMSFRDTLLRKARGGHVMGFFDE